MRTKTSHEIKSIKDSKQASALQRIGPSGESIIRPKEVKENRALSAMKDAFKKYSFRDPSSLRELRKEYDHAVKLLEGIRYTSRDVTDFPVIISRFESRGDFSEAAGFFLSALINGHKEKRFYINTRHLSKRINWFGYFNYKDVTVDGDLGESVGRHNSGTIRLNGSFVFLDVPDYNTPGVIYHNGKLINPMISFNRYMKDYFGFKPFPPLRNFKKFKIT